MGHAQGGRSVQVSLDGWLLSHRPEIIPGVAHVGGVVDGRAANVPLDMPAAVGREELDLNGAPKLLGWTVA